MYVFDDIFGEGMSISRLPSMAGTNALFPKRSFGPSPKALQKLGPGNFLI